MVTKPKMFYICWSDYDGTYVEELDSKKGAETRLAELYDKNGNHVNYGTVIHKVIEGNSKGLLWFTHS